MFLDSIANWTTADAPVCNIAPVTKGTTGVAADQLACVTKIIDEIDNGKIPCGTCQVACK